MTQPTQEDKKLIAEVILEMTWVEDFDTCPMTVHLGTSQYRNGWIPKGGGEFIDEEYFNPYTDDSFTGALVKAVFPLLAEMKWAILAHEDGPVSIVQVLSIDGFKVIIPSMRNLNTALIEAWKIHNPAKFFTQKREFFNLRG